MQWLVSDELLHDAARKSYGATGAKRDPIRTYPYRLELGRLSVWTVDRITPKTIGAVLILLL